MDNKKILNYFPIHDPYFLKNISVDPYLVSIRNMELIIEENKKKNNNNNKPE